MKKLLYLIFILPVLFIASCSDDDNTDFDIPELVTANSVQFTLVHDASPTVGKYAQISVAGKKIAIDWGDGTVEKYSTKELRSIEHIYTSQVDEYTVKVWTEHLTDLHVYNGNGTIISSSHIKIGHAPELTHLVIVKCPYLTTIDVTNCPALEYLNCYENKLESLDVSNNKKLKLINCDSNNLSSIDISSNTILNTLNCAHNQLNMLDISKNKELETLICYGNNIVTLDVSENKELTKLLCGSNQLNDLALNQMFEDLSTSSYIKTSEVIKYIIQFAGNPGAENCNKDIIINKGWSIIDHVIEKPE